MALLIILVVLDLVSYDRTHMTSDMEFKNNVQPGSLTKANALQQAHILPWKWTLLTVKAF